MKSTIKIALGQNNEPVITLIAAPTDDIRDQLCVQWCEKLQHNSQLAKVTFVANPYVDGTMGPSKWFNIISLSPTQSIINLPSTYQIGDSVSTKELVDGEVFSVRFTTCKVYYDILDKLSGKVIRDIDSIEIIQDTVSPVSDNG